MKKIFATFLLLLLVTTPILATNVKGFNSDPVTFLESMENIQNLKSYKSHQNIAGDFKLNEKIGAPMTGQFQIGITSSVYGQDAHEADADLEIKGRANIRSTGDKKTFDNLIVNFRGDVKGIIGDGLYIRLDQLDIRAIGVPLKYLQDYLNFKREFNSEVEKFKGKWIYIADTPFLDELDEDVGQELFEEEMRKKLSEDGIKETYKEMIKWYMETMTVGLIDDEEAKKINNIIDRFFETDFFTRKQVKDGYYKNFTRFFFSKRRFTNFMLSAAQEMGEDMDPLAMEELKNALSKIYFSGMHHSDSKYRIFDQFKLKVILHDLEELDKLHVQYFYKIEGINSVQKIQKPDEFTPIEELDTFFLFFFPENRLEVTSPPPTTPKPDYFDNQEVSIDDDAMKGDKDAPVTIIQFADLDGPFCARFHNQTFPSIDSKYIKTGKVRFVVRDFPLTFHPNARVAALAAECLREQEGDAAYFDYIAKIYSDQSNLSEESLKQWATELGASKTQFNSCLDNEKYAEEVDKDAADAKKYGVYGVPAFFVNGRKISGAQPLSVYEEMIEEELNN